MVDYGKEFMLYLMDEKCYDKYFLEFDLLDGDCFRALLSKGLGFGIIAGSVLVKVPQITKILANKSARGISLFSVCLDLFAITIHMAYSFVNGFPFSAWGDTSFLALQTAIIGILVLFFGGSPVASAAFTVGYGALVYVLMGGITPLSFLLLAQGFNVPILLLGAVLLELGQVQESRCFRGIDRCQETKGKEQENRLIKGATSQIADFFIQFAANTLGGLVAA
ncbi:mannose-P-dolichol utilization defect 1 protein [Anopheles darlingi]|uniref:Mannose-P-dolichol utilization defect 1 protein homolog n=1 Tax=Anopheles darlingi TaxID=43151 RepID=W5J3G2_ANODA|nr:mannose-P-dolichol utilization defect 1 protein [Anopheles darlingi]